MKLIKTKSTFCGYELWIEGDERTAEQFDVRWTDLIERLNSSLTPERIVHVPGSPSMSVDAELLPRHSTAENYDPSKDPMWEDDDD